MSEAQEVPRDVVKKEGVESKGSFLQTSTEKAKQVLNRFNEGLKRLWGKIDDKFSPVNEKAEELSKKEHADSVKNYFREELENLKDGIQAGVYDIYGGLYDIGAVVSQAKVMFWANFMGGNLPKFRIENEQNAKERRKKAKEYYAKAEEKVKGIRERVRKRREAAKELREKAANVK